MSRFTAISLASLPELEVIKGLNFEDELAFLKERLLRRAEAKGLDLSEVINLESDPLHVSLEVFAERIVKLYGEANDQIRALILATAIGAELDQIAATYYGVSRLVVIPADPNATPPTEAVLESDEDFRARIALAPEAYTTAGTRASYIFHALELDGQRDISDVDVFSNEDGATYSDTLFADAHSTGHSAFQSSHRNDADPVEPGTVLVCILPTREYGPVDQPLLDRAFEAVYPQRPLCSSLRVEPAELHEYAVDATLRIAPGTDYLAITEAARAALSHYISGRRRIGARVQLYGIAAALKVAGVEEIDLTQPVADIEPGSKGYCDCLTEPVIGVEELPAGWRP